MTADPAASQEVRVHFPSCVPRCEGCIYDNMISEGKIRNKDSPIVAFGFL